MVVRIIVYVLFPKEAFWFSNLVVKGVEVWKSETRNHPEYLKY
jgi:hypothetical protein